MTTQVMTQPIQGSNINPQLQDGATTRDITASNEYYNNNDLNFYNNTSIVFLNNPKNSINNIPRTNKDYVNPNGDGINFSNYEQRDMQNAVKESARRHVETMVRNKQADMNLRPALNALRNKGLEAYLQPNLFSKGTNDRFILTFMNPNTGKMEQIDNPEYLQQLLNE